MQEGLMLNSILSRSKLQHPLPDGQLDGSCKTRKQNCSCPLLVMDGKGADRA